MMATVKQRAPDLAKLRSRRVRVPAAPPPKQEMSKAEYRLTMGYRIKVALDDAHLTQMAAAKLIGVNSHATINNWIWNRAQPKRDQMRALARVTGKKLEWLEFGTEGPVEVIPPAEKMGYALVPEITFGDTVHDRQETAKWGLPVRWLKDELNIVDTNLALVYRVNTHAGKYEFGDRVIVDGGQTRPAPGEHLYWHGNAPALGSISVPIAPAGRKATVKVRTFADGGEETHEIEADKLHVIGRVRGTWKKA
jgi:DNA-binding XRE family transcriptional regulator